MSTKLVVAPNAAAEATLDLAQRFLTAVNTKSAEALLETIADDCIYELRTTPPLKVGQREGMAQALAGLVATWPDYDFVVHTIHADATLFYAEWTMTGTLAKPLAVGSRTAVPNGRAIAFDGVDICPVADGRVTAKISYVDAAAWYEKLSFE